MTLNPNKTYECNKLCAHTSIGDKSIILNIENGQYYELNSTSSLIWGLMNERKTFSEIIRIISDKYNAEETVISKSVTIFFNSCLELNFIQEVE
tara:strand:+ start:1757 stop:2038 length:282 start_codon:yes stop_codon:yes gene_type:complete